VVEAILEAEVVVSERTAPARRAGQHRHTNRRRLRFVDGDITSGHVFGPHTAAAEVVAGVDLTNLDSIDTLVAPPR
jgi:hypothetical protein